MSSIFLGGNIHIELTMDGIDYFKDKQQLNANNTGGQNIIINEVNGGQLNIAQDGSHITSTQNNGLQADKLEMIIKDIMDNLNGLNEEQYETIIDSIEMAREELINPQPKKSILRTCIKMLSPIITAVNGTPALYENLQKLNEIITSYLA